MGDLWYACAVVGIVPWVQFVDLFGGPNWLKIALLVFQFLGLVGLVVNLIRTRSN